VLRIIEYRFPETSGAGVLNVKAENGVVAPVSSGMDVPGRDVEASGPVPGGVPRKICIVTVVLTHAGPLKHPITTSISVKVPVKPAVKVSAND